MLFLLRRPTVPAFAGLRCTKGNKAMNAETHSQLASFIWSICNLLRGPYKRNEYRKVILPLTVLRRFDCLLASTKAKVLEEYPKLKGKPENVVRSLLQKVSSRPTSTGTSASSRRTSAASWSGSRSISRSRAWPRRTCSTRSSRRSRSSICPPATWTTCRWATCSRS